MGKFVLLLAASLGMLLSSYADQCCQRKVVGDEEYLFVESDPEETSQSDCADSCVYEKAGVPGSRICFKPGTQENQCLADCICGVPLKDQDPRIINGSPVNVTDFPWYLGLSRFDRVNGGSSFCGASLISRKWALTAAHCVTNYIYEYYGCDEAISTPMVAKPSDVILLLELADAYTAKAGLRVDIISVPDSFIDAVYGGGNDIALLRLVDEVDVNYYPTLCLPWNPDNFVNEDGVIIGYGFTQPGDPPTADPEYLMKGDVEIVDNQICDDLLAKYNLKVPDDGICAGGVSTTCYGDSGGALMTKIPGTNKYELRGVTSFGSNVTCGDDYSVFANVSYHLDWIKTTVARYGGMGAACV